MNSKTVVNLARIFCVFLVVSLNHPSVCSPIAPQSECIADGSNPESLLYSLFFSEEFKNVTVYYRHCSNLSTIGPSWYRLEVTNSTNSEAVPFSFMAPKNKSGAVLRNDGIEFSASDDEPLVLFDLPRTFKYSTNSPLENICFRLTIKQEDHCEQVVSSCTYEESSGKPEPLAEKGQPIPYEIIVPETIKDHCYVKHNCTGKIKKVCGTDGIYYDHVCKLRLQKCLYDIADLQRDRTNISCNTVTTAPPPPKPPCIDFVESISDYSSFYIPKCDQYGFFKPVQCWTGDNQGILKCACYTKSSGSSYDPWEVQNCNITTNISLPQSHCGI